MRYNRDKQKQYTKKNKQVYLKLKSIFLLRASTQKNNGQVTKLPSSLKLRPLIV